MERNKDTAKNIELKKHPENFFSVFILKYYPFFFQAGWLPDPLRPNSRIFFISSVEEKIEKILKLQFHKNDTNLLQALYHFYVLPKYRIRQKLKNFNNFKIQTKDNPICTFTNLLPHYNQNRLTTNIPFRLLT